MKMIAAIVPKTIASKFGPSPTNGAGHPKIKEKFYTVTKSILKIDICNLLKRFGDIIHSFKKYRTAITLKKILI